MHINKMASNRLFYINNNMFICVLISLLLPTAPESATRVLNDHWNMSNDDGGHRLTREYDLRQGALRGLIVKPNHQYDLQSVEMFLGIPYAAPPVGNFRFMPPASATSWSGVKMATRFAPVCPQSLPAKEKGDPQSLGRQRYMERLEPFLAHESEDCLYLNIYVPYREQKSKKFPVLIFIHGDSFEWSSGNPYDGRILASYGNIMVITFNYRLGILGFMKPSMTEYVYNNNGLLDQLAALQWIKDNIEDLNGDPNSVTLMGHGTGAACVSFLMLSPLTNGLFHRAILMSGSALSDWALTKDPTQSTSQVAQGLGCNPTSIHLMNCLQNKSLAEIRKVQILAREFETPLGAVVAGSFIPDKPLKIMASFPNLLSKYQLLCGVTEFESYHDFGAIELEHGILDTQRDEFIAKYTNLIFEGAGEVGLKDILKQYSPSKLDPQRWDVETNRDVILNLFSDARTLAPLVKFTNYHSKANRQSYFYVFGHNSVSTHYAPLNKSVHGEELPYVLGVPLGGCNTHFHSQYTPKEKLLSEAIMRLWTNFVKIGTPNTQSVNEYFTLDRRQWNHYNIEWPEYNVEHQSYLKLDIPPHISSFYRSNYTKFWNEIMPNKMRRFIHDPLYDFSSLPITHKPKATNKVQDPIEKEIRTHTINTPRPNASTYGRVKPYSQSGHPSDNNSIYREIQSFKHSYRNNSHVMEKTNVHSTTVKPKSDISSVQVKSSGSTITLIVSLGILFLVVNIGICTILCLKKRKNNLEGAAVQTSNNTRAEIGKGDVIGRKSLNEDKTALKTLKNSCNVIKSMSFKKIRGNNQQCKKQETCKTPKSDDSGGFRERFQLRRHLSTSTLDAHTKVRDWITNEVMHRCSPNIIRKSNSELDNNQYIIMAKPFTRSEEILSELKYLRTNALKLNDNYLIKEFHGDFSQQYGKNKIEASENNSTVKSNSTISGKIKINNSSLKGARKSSDSLKSKASQSFKSRTVSVAIDATPFARTNSILQQDPIELTKSFDNQEYSGNKNTIQCNESKINKTLNKKNDVLFMNEIILSVKNEKKPLNIYHTHSSSDPITNINYKYLSKSKNSSNDLLDKVLPLVTFHNDINVTSKDDGVDDQLATMDALLTIKRRKFPKVLPDLPQSQKRFSLQATTLQTFRSNTEGLENELEHAKIPPVPPPRTTTLDQKMTFQYAKPFSSFETTAYPLDYENIENISLHSPTDDCFHTFKTVDNCITPGKRKYPKVIIASSHYSSTQKPTYLTQASPKQICLSSKVPRVTLPDDFHSYNQDFSTLFSSVFSADEIRNCSENVEEEKLIQELVGGIDFLTNEENLLDSKGPAKAFENKLEIVPVKVNASHILTKAKKNYVVTTDLQLPDLSGFEKTAQIKPNYGINKLQQRSESIYKPTEKTVKVTQKGLIKQSVIINPEINTVIRNSEKSKTNSYKLEHSHSGSSNDTEASKETIKESKLPRKSNKKT